MVRQRFQSALSDRRDGMLLKLLLIGLAGLGLYLGWQVLIQPS